MAIRLLDDVHIQFGSFDASALGTSAKLEYNADEVESSAFGVQTHTFLGGLKNWSVEVEANNDVAGASSLFQTLFALVGTTAVLTLRHDKSDGVGVNNPNLQGTALLSGLPWGGAIGELSKTTIKFVAAGNLSVLTS